MDLTAIWPIASEQGLIVGLVALGVVITFKVLAFPDLTVDGSFALGGAVTAALIVKGIHPAFATLTALVTGLAAGSLTGLIHTKLRISGILAGILVMMMLYSINLRIMGRPNVPLLNQSTILPTVSEGSSHISLLIFLIVLALLIVGVLQTFFRTTFGVLTLATGDNPQATLAAGMSPHLPLIVGISIANGLTALSGSLMAQQLGFSDVGMGLGIVIVGFASLLIGETVLRAKSISWLLPAALIGSIIYQGLINLALRIEFLSASDLKLTNAVLVIGIMFLQGRRRNQRIR
jgi:putative ABC transport system permease protein